MEPQSTSLRGFARNDLGMVVVPQTQRGLALRVVRRSLPAHLYRGNLRSP